MSMKFNILRSQLETRAKLNDAEERSRSCSSDRGGKQINFSNHGQKRMTTAPQQKSEAKNSSKDYRYIKDRLIWNVVFID